MEWMHIIISAVSGGALAQFFTLIVQRKKTVAEVKTNELENVEKAIVIWRSMAEDLKREVIELRQEVKYLRTKLEKPNEKPTDN